MLLLGRESKQISRPHEFQLNYPITVSVIPELGPLEHEEEVVLEETVRRGLNTHRASRHFRNYWRYYPEEFEAFRATLRSTWPGTDIELPRMENPLDSKLTMLCREGNIPRELYWAGFGFQVWCQLLTHIQRAQGSTLMVVDEPETYLHPNLQRQVLHLLRESPSDVLLATHSSEIVAEAEPTEVLIVDRTRRSARRAGDLQGVQGALTHIGSGRNVVLTQLARTSKALLVEGDDFTIIRSLARVLQLPGLGSGGEIAPIPLEGFPSVERFRSMCEGIRESLGPEGYIAACFDRDHRCDEEVDWLTTEFAKHADAVCILVRHEIENYLLSPPTIDKALSKAALHRSARGALRSDPPPAMEIVETATDELRGEVVASRGAERGRFFRASGLSAVSANRAAVVEVDGRWRDMEERIRLVPGKELLSGINRLLQPSGISLSPQSLLNVITRDDVAVDLGRFLRKVEKRIAPKI